ncbi:hypothetical protein TcBrA4_0007010 [Trypanosoma cruzi]|nr:hypothetical protein TcBrA4_0007010 [Trypanosoma cruzi]
MAAGAWSRQGQLVLWRRARREGGIEARTRWTILRWRMKAFSTVFHRLFFRSAACRCLTGCLCSAPFEALRSFIQGDVAIIMAAPSLTGFECDNTNDGQNNDEDDDGLHREADYLRFLAHESQEGLSAVPTIPGLAELLAFALSPTVISAHALRLIHLPWISRSSSRVFVLLIPRWPIRMYLGAAWRVVCCVLSRPPPPVFFWCPIRNTLRCGGYLLAWPLTHVTMLNGCVFCLAGTRETSGVPTAPRKSSLTDRGETKGGLSAASLRAAAGHSERTEWMDGCRAAGETSFLLRPPLPGESRIRSVTASCILLLGIDCAEVARLV